MSISFYNPRIKFYNARNRFYIVRIRFHNARIRFHIGRIRFYIARIRFYITLIRFYITRIRFYITRIRFHIARIRFYIGRIRFYNERIRFYIARIRFCRWSIDFMVQKKIKLPPENVTLFWRKIEPLFIALGFIHKTVMVGWWIWWRRHWSIGENRHRKDFSHISWRFGRCRKGRFLRYRKWHLFLWF